MTIDISGLDKGVILAALWNSAALPPAHIHASPRTRPMSVEEGRSAVIDNEGGFDYYEDRLLKINLSGDTLDPWGYDRDNGAGLAAKVIRGIRAGQS